MCLDKDILVKGNKIYSPETCVFAPERINYLFVKAIKRDRDGVIGVQFNKDRNKYEVSYNKLKINNQILYIRSKKYFDNINDAFLYYKNEKETFIRIVADYYKDKIPKKLYNAMYNWKVDISD